jgi:outer membrane protein OmpA-like peptidoglycan-associated protein
MKKLFLMLAVAMMTVSASAQNTALTANKFGDNWYFGINGGVMTPATGGDYGFMKALCPTAGIRIGKNLTTVFGLVAEGDVYTQSNEKWGPGPKTMIEGLNASLLGSFNLSNLFGGYKGEPRTFELIALYGFGWGHAFNHYSKSNTLTSTAALDLTFNLGASKGVQFFIEPSITYGLAGWYQGEVIDAPMKYDRRAANVGLKAGFNFKFNTSNGTKNFAFAQLRDQSEIDALNAQINQLRADNSAKDGRIAADGRAIADLRAQLTACQNQPKQTETRERLVIKNTKDGIPVRVLFQLGKSSIDASQYANIEMVAKYMRNHKDARILISGYASPEGDPEKNKKLSEDRANAVKQALVKRYKIDENRLSTEGLGATDELYEEIDFNRIVIFTDTTRQND